MLIPVEVWAQSLIRRTDQLIEKNGGYTGQIPEVALSGSRAGQAITDSSMAGFRGGHFSPQVQFLIRRKVRR